MSQITQVFNYEIFENKLIGKGQFGIVLECRHKTKHFNEELCVKIVNCNQNNSVIDLQTYKEIQILKEIKNIQNQHIISTFDIFENDRKYYIVMEKSKDGDLKQHIEKQKLKQQYFQASELLDFVYQFCKGYKTLVAHNILHRDIKPQNIFVNLNPLTFKIGDLGAGRILENARVKGNYTCIGTPLYSSPQICDFQQYSNKTDVYSLGMVLFELCFLRLPFEQNYTQILQFNNQIKFSKFIISQNLPTFGSQEDKDEIKFLIQNMIIFEEDQRLSWDDLFQRIENNNCYAQFKSQVNLNQSTSKITQKGESTSRLLMQSCINNPQFKVSEVENNIQNIQINYISPLRQVIRLLLAKYHLVDKFLNYLQDAIQTQQLQFRSIEYFSLICATFGYQNSIFQQIHCIYTGEVHLISQHIQKQQEIFKKNKECIENFQKLKTQQDNEFYHKFKDQYYLIIKNRNENQIIENTIDLINKQKIKLCQLVGLRELLKNRTIDCLQFSNLLTFFCEFYLQNKIQQILTQRAADEITQNFGLFIAIHYEIQNLENRIPQIEYFKEKKFQLFPKLDWTQEEVANMLIKYKEQFLKQKK